MEFEDMLKLKPGYDLNVLVAEKIFKWEDKDSYWLRKDEKYKDKPELGKKLTPPFSTFIEYAWQIVEEMKISLINSEDGWYAVVTKDVVHTCNSTIFDNAKEIHGKYWALAETAPEAICKAGLMATMK